MSVEVAEEDREFSGIEIATIQRKLQYSKLLRLQQNKK